MRNACGGLADGCWLLALFAEAQLEFHLALDITLVPRDVHAQRIPRLPFARLRLWARRRSVAAGRRREDLTWVPAETGDFSCQTGQPAGEYRRPAPSTGDSLLDVTEN